MPGLTQEALATRLGLKARAVQDWEAGYGIPSSKLHQLAEVLRVPLEHITEGAEIGKDDPRDLGARVSALEAGLSRLAAATERVLAAQRGEDRRVGDQMRGGFPQVAELINRLSDEFRGEIDALKGAVGIPSAPDEPTSLREALAVQSGLLLELLREVEGLRREAAVARSGGGAAQSRRAPGEQPS